MHLLFVYLGFFCKTAYILICLDVMIPKTGSHSKNQFQEQTPNWPINPVLWFGVTRFCFTHITSQASITYIQTNFPVERLMDVFKSKHKTNHN